MSSGVPILDGLERRPPPSSRPAFVPSPPDVQTLVHVEQRTVRSGEKVAAEGHLIVIGDVNPGAEVIAGYNIFVWGALNFAIGTPVQARILIWTADAPSLASSDRVREG